LLQEKGSFYSAEGIANQLKIRSTVCKYRFLHSQRQKLADTPQIPDLGDQSTFTLEDIHSADKSSPEVSVLGTFKLSPLSVMEKKIHGGKPVFSNTRNQSPVSFCRKYLDDYYF